MSDTTDDATAAPNESPAPTPQQGTQTPEQPATGDMGGQQLGDAGKKAIQTERDARKKAEESLKALQQQVEDSKKSAEQKSADALAKAQAKATEESAKALRYEVAAEKGLDLALAARLTGSTKEELEADADSLMELIPKAPEVAPDEPPAGPTVPGQQPGGAQTSAQVTTADLDALAKEGKYDEINRLRREGRLSHLGVAPSKAST